MAQFNKFVGGSSSQNSVTADSERTVNLFVEAIESGNGQNTAYLRNTPGLTLSQTLPTSPHRGIWIGEGRLFCVAGSKLYEVWAPLAGTVNTSGTGVTWVSGNQFNSSLVGAVINIAAVAYTVLSVTDLTHLVLTATAGTQTAAAFTIYYNQLGDVGDDAAHSPAQIFPNSTQLLIISAGLAFVADGVSVTPCLYPNRFGQISIVGTAITWISGAKFDATMVGGTIFINTVPWVVASYASTTSIALTAAPGDTVSAAYNMALAVTGTATPDGTATVPWTSGAKFDSGMVGESFAINGVSYTIAAFTDDTHLVMSVVVPAHAAIAFSITSPVFASCGAFLDGYGIVVKPSTKQINISALNDFKTWNLLDFALKQGYPDNIATILADHEELCIFGTATSEVWRNTGATFPFERDPGAFIAIGCVAAATAVRLGNGVAFLGGDTRGVTVAYRATGYVPTRVSTHTEETAWASYSTTADAVAYVYREDGHEFWVISFPSGNATWVYDATSGLWHERGWWNGSGNDRQRGAYHGYVFGKYWQGDWQNGKLYTASSAVYTDNAVQIQRIRACPHLSTEHLWSFYSRFELLMESGTGASPTITLDWSDDGGHTFGTAHTATSGTAGEYTHRVIWRRLGKSRDRVFRVTITAAVKIALINAFLDVEAGNS